MVRACLVDVYDTIVYSDFRARVRILTASIGVDPDAWVTAWSATGTERGQGKLSMADSFTRTLRACGVVPSPSLVERLVSEEAELLRDGSRLFGDAAGFLAELRSRGIGIALVSNCSQSTRQMLEHLGVTEMADAVILSCEAGFLKPSPEIYLAALDDLGAAPADALMVDDQARFCAGAQAVGVRAIQIVRADRGKQAMDSDFPVVTTLLDVLPLL